MTDTIARDQLRSIIDRILRLKEEQDALGADIREIYAEAKSNGYDKTALGNVVAHVRKRTKKGAAEVAEADAIFDLYLSAYDGAPSRAHVRAREDQAASRKAPLESPGSPIAAEGLVSDRDRYVRGHAAVNADQREHGQQTASSEDAETPPLKAAVGMTAGETAPLHSPVVGSEATPRATTPRAGGGDAHPPPRGTPSDDLALPAFLRREPSDADTAIVNALMARG